MEDVISEEAPKEREALLVTEIEGVSVRDGVMEGEDALDENTQDHDKATPPRLLKLPSVTGVPVPPGIFVTLPLIKYTSPLPAKAITLP